MICRGRHCRQGASDAPVLGAREANAAAASEEEEEPEEGRGGAHAFDGYDQGVDAKGMNHLSSLL